MRTLLVILAATFTSTGLLAQNADFCNANCQRIKAGILENEQKSKQLAKDAEDARRNSSQAGSAPGAGQALPGASRPVQLTPSEIRQQAESERDVAAYKAASRAHADAEVAEAERWLPTDRAKAFSAYQRACAEVWATHGCGMAAEMQFRGLEDRLYKGDLSNQTFRSEAEGVRNLAQHGCENNERLACFVQRRVWMALKVNVGPDLTGLDAQAFADYDAGQRSLVASGLYAHIPTAEERVAAEQASVAAEKARIAEEEYAEAVRRNEAGYKDKSPAARVFDLRFQHGQPLEELKKALRLDPDYFPALLEISSEFAKLNDFDQAAEALRHAEAACSADVYADAKLWWRRVCLDQNDFWRLVGEAWRNIGKLPEAERAFEGWVAALTKAIPASATRQQREDAELWQRTVFLAWLALAEVQRMAHNDSDAMTSIDKGLQVQPTDPNLWALEGDILTDLNKPQDALVAYTKAGQSDLAGRLIKIKLADSLCANGQRERALALFDGELKNLRNPSDIQARDAARARCLERAK